MDRKINIVFKLSSLGVSLNKKNFKNNFISMKDIDWLVSNNIIRQVSEDKYIISDVNSYLEYGVSLLKKINYKDADLCIKQCYNLDPRNRDANLHYMRICLIKGQYDRVLEIYDNLITIDSDKYKNENNLYLYLLGIIMKLNDKYANLIKSFNEKDIMLPGCDNNRLEYDIVKSIYNNKFTFALKLINDLRNKDDNYSIRDEMLQTLLNKVVDNEKNFRREILELVNEDKYKEIMQILVDRQNQRKLSKLELFIYIIVDAIIDMLEHNVVRVSMIEFTDDIYKALMGYNFELASKINDRFFENNKENQKNDVLSILLLKVNDLEKQIIDNSFEETNYDIDKYNVLIDEAVDLANYIRGLGINLNNYIRKVGLIQKYALLVKLVYARDYYIDGDYKSGDKMILDVSVYSSKDEDVVRFLEEVKSNRDRYNNDRNLLRRVKK